MGLREPVAAETETKGQLSISVSLHLHPDTQTLVREFAEAMALKLRRSELRYGYSNGWLTDPWMDICRREFYSHIEKGDPRDVAIYAAFMWKRGWPILR